MKYYVKRKTCKLKTNYIYHKMYTCFFLNSRPRKSGLDLQIESVGARTWLSRNFKLVQNVHVFQICF